ncbi:hypothetical protein GCM10022221_67160 [Actinocorallia aurea]
MSEQNPEAAPAEHRPIVYVDMAGVAEWFGVSRAAVAQWRSRYAGSSVEAGRPGPCPEPDAMTGSTPGWLPEREAEWRRWEASRLGSGHGKGGPKPKP